MKSLRVSAVLAMALAGFSHLAPRATAQTFQHPGVLVSKAQLDFIKGQVNAHINPYYKEFQNAQASPYGSLTYVIQGPYAGGVNQCGSSSNPNYGCSAGDSDSTAAYVQALLWYITGNQTYATNAINIMNAYGHNLKGFAGFSPGYPCPGAATTCSNGPLQAAWDSTKFPRAAEIIRYGNGGRAGWAAADIQAFSNMLANVYEPLIYNGSGDNGNWELSMIEGMMGIAVFNEDLALLAHAQLFWSQRVPAYFYYYPIDGSAPAPFPRTTGSTTWNGQTVFDARVNGVSQETCRDLKHTEYGISSAMAAAETDHIQGGTLFESQEPRLIAGLEFNSGLESANSTAVPSYLCGGTITLGTGATYVVGYNEYRNRLAQTLPNTALWIQNGVLPLTAPYDIGAHMTVFEPLTHYMDASSGTPDFALNTTPTTQTVVAGSGTSYSIGVTALSGYSGNVALSISSGLPIGAAAGFVPATVTGGIGSSTLTVTTTGAIAAGSYSLQIAATDGTLTHNVFATLSVVTATTLTITANPQSVALGGTLPTLTYSASPNVALDTPPTCVSANGTGTAGVYPTAITCSGAAKAGYTFSYVAGQLTVVSGSTITVTATNQAMTYGGTIPALTYSATGGLSTKPTCVTTTNATTAPGVYAGAITCSGAARSGYTILYVAGQMTVNAIAATITANNQTMVAGSAVPSLTYSSSASGISYTADPICSTTATPASPAGMYMITCANAASVGYSFSYVAGTLIVTAGPQNIWILNGNSTMSEMNSSGAGLSPGSGYSSGGSGIAIDGSGNLWSANSSGNSIVELSSGGVVLGSYSGGGLSAPAALAVSGGGDVWIANGNNSVSLISNNGTAMSPATGFTGAGLNTPAAIAIDNSGNVWVANSGNNSLTQFLGATDPVVTPMATAAGAGTLGAKP